MFENNTGTTGGAVKLVGYSTIMTQRLYLLITQLALLVEQFQFQTQNHILLFMLSSILQ